MPTPKKTNRTEEDQKVLWEIGDRIEIARKRAEIKNQTMLGEMVGSSQGVVSDWETGKSEIGVLSLIKLAKALNISLDELVMGAVQEVERETKKEYTLRDTCEFLFMTLPAATGATFSLVDVEEKSLYNRLNRFDCDKHPRVQLSIPLPVVILHDPETSFPTGEVRLNECGREMAIFANEVRSLNACVRPQLADVYDRQLVNVPNTPLDTFRLENSDNGIPF